MEPTILGERKATSRACMPRNTATTIAIGSICGQNCTAASDRDVIRPSAQPTNGTNAMMPVARPITRPYLRPIQLSSTADSRPRIRQTVPCPRMKAETASLTSLASSRMVGACARGSQASIFASIGYQSMSR